MAVQGSLEELSIPDLIQLVSAGAKTGVFELRRGQQTGQIYLNRGRIVDAAVGELQGDEAVFALLLWQEGEFAFLPGAEHPTVTVQMSNSNLLMEGARRIDEWKVLSKKIPSLDLIPAFTPTGGATSVSFNPQEWAIVRRIDEHRSIDEIAALVAMPTFDVCKVLYGLLSSEVLELRGQAAPPPPPPPEPSAPAPEPAAPLVAGATADRQKQINDLHAFFNQHIRETLGLRGFMLQLQAEKASSLGDFFVLRDPFLTAVRKAKGEAVAVGLETALDKLLQ